MEMGNNPELNDDLHGKNCARVKAPTVPVKDIGTIMKPHENDILMGRGGKNNQHEGNERFRELARRESEKYRLASKKGKSFISRELVRQVRMMDPPGRFLKKNADTGEFEDVGDDVAREKASQVLRDAVSVTTPSNRTGEGSDEESVRHVKKIPVSLEPERPVSAPTVIMTAPRRRSWEDTERYTYTPRCYEPRSYSSEMHSPAQVSSRAYYPSVTPSSSSVKRQRYHSNSWDDRLVSRVETSPIVSQYRYRDFPRPYSSNPNFSRRDIYAPETRMRDVDSGLDDFDLFNGQLWESDDEL